MNQEKLSPPQKDHHLLKRKRNHVDLCLTQNVEAGTQSWDQIILPHLALPEIDWDEVNIKTDFLGESFSAPILISAMTGGEPKGDKMNERLAKFAMEENIPMVLGSMRYLAENPKSKSARMLRKAAPKAKLYANIGAVQLNYGVKPEHCQRLVDELGASGLVIHCNPLQEVIQKEGNKNFKGIWKKLEHLRNQIAVPLILKETGCGLDPESCKLAKEIGFDALDIAGHGGTHWGYIEGLRNRELKSQGELFLGWGIPTPQAIKMARNAVGPHFPIIGSGGIRSGLDGAKALALGANLMGLALPFLKAANKNTPALIKLFEEITMSLKIALFCSGSKNPREITIL